MAAGCVVSSLHDGMNLVAKEFVAAREDERGVLVLSKFTGAARELTDAVLVNPFDVEQLAAGLHAALTMRSGGAGAADASDAGAGGGPQHLSLGGSTLERDRQDGPRTPAQPAGVGEDLNEETDGMPRTDLLATLRLANG